MSNYIHLFQDVKKTYKTPENAAKIFDKVANKFPKENFRFSVSTVKVSSEYRFIPVAHLDQRNMYLVATLIDLGLCVTG